MVTNELLLCYDAYCFLGLFPSNRGSMHRYYTNKKVNKTLQDVNIEQNSTRCEHWLIKHIMSGKLM